MSKTGPKPVLDDVKSAEIMALLSQGCSRRAAAEYVGCSHNTIANTAKRDEKFARRMRQAEILCELNALRNINSGSLKSWRAAAWLLERTRPERYEKVTLRQPTFAQMSDFWDECAGAVLQGVPEEYRAPIQEKLHQTSARFARLIKYGTGHGQGRPTDEELDKSQVAKLDDQLDEEQVEDLETTETASASSSSETCEYAADPATDMMVGHDTYATTSETLRQMTKSRDQLNSCQLGLTGEVAKSFESRKSCEETSASEAAQASMRLRGFGGPGAVVALWIAVFTGLFSFVEPHMSKQKPVGSGWPAQNSHAGVERLMPVFVRSYLKGGEIRRERNRNRKRNFHANLAPGDLFCAGRGLLCGLPMLTNNPRHPPSRGQY